MNFHSALVARLAASAESFVEWLRAVRLRGAVPPGNVIFVNSPAAGTQCNTPG